MRGYSMFELSFVYVLFDDSTDIYWARSRVLEYLNFARDRLPAGVQPKLGPDATGVGWVYQYVLFPGCASLGVKLRERRFEIKTQARLLGPGRLAPGVEGVVATWTKLAFEVPGDAQLARAVRAEAATVAVAKQRWVRLLTPDDASQPITRTSDMTIAQGCAVELCRLRLRDSEWWSVGLEAFGDPSRIERCLRRAVPLALAANRLPCELTVRNSMGYPTWFAALGLA